MFKEDPTIDDEFELREALTRRTSDIRKFIRPVKGALDQAVPVQHRLALILIIDFSEDTGLFSGLFYNRLVSSVIMSRLCCESALSY